MNTTRPAPLNWKPVVASLFQALAGKGDDESKRTFSLLLVTSQESPNAIRDAIHDTMRHQCQCQHDCCGHWQSSVNRIRRLKSGLWAVIEGHNRNI